MLKVLRFSSVLLFTLLVVALCVDARVALRGNDELASQASMQRAVELIKAHRKPSTLIVHSPLLSMRELSHLKGLSASPDLPRPRLRTSRRILVLDVASSPMHGFGSATRSFPIEGPRPLNLRLFEPTQQGGGVLFDLYTDLEQAHMRIERPAGTVVSQCTQLRSEGGRSCPGQAEWLYLDRRELTLNRKKQTCVWSHPTTGGVIVIELPKMQAPGAGGSLWLKLTVGLTDDAVNGTPGGAHVDTIIQQNKKIIGRIRALNKIGLFSKEVPINPNEKIKLMITSPKDGRRHHCVNASIEERR